MLILSFIATSLFSFPTIIKMFLNYVNLIFSTVNNGWMRLICVWLLRPLNLHAFINHIPIVSHSICNGKPQKKNDTKTAKERRESPQKHLRLKVKYLDCKLVDLTINLRLLSDDPINFIGVERA